jgi:thiol-disulfide isomerase/thioredoxin
MLFILTLRLNLTDADWARVTTTPDHPPVFIFAWTPWCGYCRAAMPGWRKLSAELSSDPSVVMASLNCTAQSALCRSMGIRGYPTFYDYFRGFLRRPRLSNHSFASFSSEAVRLRRIAKGEFVIAQRPSRVHFPSFVFRLNKSDNASKAIAREVAGRSPFLLDSRFYFEFGAFATPGVTALLGKKESVEMKGDFALEAVAGFVADYPITPFSGWKFFEIEKMRRLFGLYFEKEGAEPPEAIVKWAKGLTEEVLFGKFESLGKKKFDNLFDANKSEVPIVVLLSMKERKYQLIQRATPEKLDAFLAKYRKGEAVMKPFNETQTAGNKTSVEKETPVIIAEEESTDQENLKTVKKSGVSVTMIGGGLVVLAAILQFVRRHLASKQD